MLFHILSIFLSSSKAPLWISSQQLTKQARFQCRNSRGGGGAREEEEEECCCMRANTNTGRTVQFIVPALQKILGPRRKGKTQLLMSAARDGSAPLEMLEPVSTMPAATWL